eukprot:CCRYP_016761-RA/>CCRYP_016761-RA protein AED:0.28 eAED:0.28 QI:130/0/0.5/1/0/0/2/0/330
MISGNSCHQYPNMPRMSRKQRLEAERKNRIFPGPKMKPRPPDFDEELVRKSPTFIKWLGLKDGEPLKYACRTFVKGNGDDEERLMRRIMIARRNNLKDHAVLKKARALEAERVRNEAQAASPLPALPEGDLKPSSTDSNEGDVEDMPQESSEAAYVSTNPSGTKRRYIPGKLRPADHEIRMEMDIPAVEATRSYRKWLTLANGEKMTYNQVYVKGDPEQDWLLRKNIWRRMRYRRENQQKVRELQSDELNEAHESAMVQSVVDAAVAAAASVAAVSFDAAAVAALDADTVNDPLVSSALDAAAQLAAAVIPQHHVVNMENQGADNSFMSV